MPKPYDPRAWIWRTDDGSRLFSAAAGTLVAETDPIVLAFVADGSTPTRWPVDDTGAQTDDALQWVFDNAGVPVFVALVRLKAALAASIDTQAEAQRALYITTGSGQAMIYLQKQSQAIAALQALAATPPMTAEAGKAAYALLAAEIGITADPTTGQGATDVFGVARAVVATVQAWLPIGADIEAVRLKSKAAIAAATTVSAARAAHDDAVWPAAG